MTGRLPPLQQFDPPTMATSSARSHRRLAAVRAWMAAHGLDGYLLPRADAHQGEHLAPCDERLAWLTGFTGSAGLAVVLPQRAALFSDGRYEAQMKIQLAGELFEPLDSAAQAPEAWLAANACAHARIGFDPMLHTGGQIETLCRKCAGRFFLPVRENPVDTLWADRPAPLRKPIRAHPVELAGRSSAQKRATIAALLREKGARACLLNATDSIAWLLNLRGSDLPRLPCFQAFCLVRADGSAILFTDPDRLDAAARVSLDNAVSFRPPDALARTVAEEGRDGLALSREKSPHAFFACAKEAGAKVIPMRDPCLLPKACKTEAEIEGARKGHLQDGAALVRFLSWFERAAGAGEPLDEMSLARRLEAFRLQSGVLRDIAFDTIAGAGDNGAIIHYRVTHESNRTLSEGELFLCDSGAQYDFATTDVTRTLVCGAPCAEQRRFYTLVLKGLIALSRARFPEGTAGRALDSLARLPLWEAGHDYAHGTGHGVGSYLSVHEGPQRISRNDGTPLKAGMILSIEPGFYREGRFGIRLENLVLVSPAFLPEGGTKTIHHFETLTLVPFSRALIMTEMLEGTEIAWLDAYHAHVAARLDPLLAHGPHHDAAARAWLATSCRPMAEGGT